MIKRIFNSDDVDCAAYCLARARRAKKGIKAVSEIYDALVKAKSNNHGVIATHLRRHPELLIQHNKHLLAMRRAGTLDQIKKERRAQHDRGFKFDRETETA